MYGFAAPGIEMREKERWKVGEGGVGGRRGTTERV